MCQRDAAVSRHTQRRSDSRNDFEPNAGGPQGFSFFASAAKHVGVSSLEPDDLFPGASLGDHHVADLLLAVGVLGPLLSDVDDVGFRASVRQQLRRRQGVIKNNVRRLDQAQTFLCDELGVTRTAPHEVDDAREITMGAPTHFLVDIPRLTDSRSQSVLPAPKRYTSYLLTWRPLPRPTPHPVQTRDADREPDRGSHYRHAVSFLAQHLVRASAQRRADQRISR